MRKKSWQSKKMENLYFLWQMVQQNYQEDTANSKNPLWDGNPPLGERISAKNLTAIGKSFDLKNKKTTQKIGNNFGLFKDTSLLSPYWTESSTCVPREESFLMSKIYILERNSSRRNMRCGWWIGESQHIWGKNKFNYIDIAGKGRNSVPYYNFAHEFVPTKRSQESSSLSRWEQAHVVSSRGTAYLWDKILQVTVKNRRVRYTLECELGKKEVWTPNVFWSANFGNRELRMDQNLSLRDACLGKPRSMKKRSFNPSNVDSRMQRRQWKWNERRS